MQISNIEAGLERDVTAVVSLVDGTAGGLHVCVNISLR